MRPAWPPGSLRPRSSDPTTPAGSAAGPDEARNVRLQYLRGLAALAVMLMHASDNLGLLRGDGRFLAFFPHVLGAYGVAIFFALSGLLMAQLIRRDAPLRFLLDRILRIYPLLLMVVALAALAFLATGFGRRPELLTLTLVPAGARDYFLGGVEWTLLYEMTYYVALTLLALAGLRRLAEPLAALWLGGLVLLALAGREPAFVQFPTITQLPMQAANCAFLLGFLLPRALSSKATPPAWLLLASGLALAIPAFAYSGANGRWLTALSALCLVAAAQTAPSRRPGGPVGRFGARLGDASYALYLCHVPVILLSANLLPASLPTPLVWLIWVAGALAAALGLGLLDIGLHARLKRWARGLPPRRIAAASLVFLAAFIGIAAWADVTERRLDDAALKAQSALAKNQPIALPQSVLAAVDGSFRTPDGRLFVRGYGIDLGRPDGDAHIALLQGGEIVGFDRMRRMRPAAAQAAARPDLASIRFGFSVGTRAMFDCAGGMVEARLILADGRVLRLTGDAQGDACRGPGRTP